LSLKNALVIFSGGQDSTTCLKWALNRFDTVSAITFDYGQKHKIELDVARRICTLLNVEQKIVSADCLSQLSPNALVDSSIAVSESGGFLDLPSTFVPGRNIFFLTLAASWAVTKGIHDLVIGTCQTDFSGYPDCRDEFIASMEQSLNLGLGVGTLLTIHRPLMFLTKAQTFLLAKKEGVLDLVIDESHTCYEGDRSHKNAWGFGCGACPACKLRSRGYDEYLSLK